MIFNLQLRVWTNPTSTSTVVTNNATCPQLNNVQTGQVLTVYPNPNGWGYISRTHMVIFQKQNYLH